MTYESQTSSDTQAEAWREREYALLEEIKWLKGQITYLQEELAAADNLVGQLRDDLATYDEGFM